MVLLSSSRTYTMNIFLLHRSVNYLKQGLLAFTVLVFSASSYAGFTQISTIIETNNDCNGYFATGNGFSNCEVLIRNDSNDVVYLTGAKVIVKFNGSLGYSAGDSDYANNTGFSNLTSENKTGTWTAQNNYPGIRFWDAKAGAGPNGSGVQLFWMVDETQVTNGGPCYSGSNSLNFTIACMELAQTVTSGNWTTPSNKGLSHLTFFGGLELCTENCSGNTVVPEPSAILLFALGLLGFAGYRKKTG